jgi:hypothetical protein
MRPVCTDGPILPLLNLIFGPGKNVLRLHARLQESKSTTSVPFLLVMMV